ncbi:SMP-30/gluconolactonase/LRE family protein [bacterium]|nr:SMP-30/gluconolactonase/LRE family protein [bacterium]
MKQTFACVSSLTLLSLLVSGVSGTAADKIWNLPKTPDGAYVDRTFPTIGEVERLDGALDKLIAPGTKIELLAKGFTWSEGPVWAWRRHSILFSDVPENTIYEWDQTHDLYTYLKPSGNTGPTPGEGSNGLTIDSQGRLVLAQHGDRRIARLNPDGSFETIAQYYKWNRFNSPNDLVYRSNGDLYFTDPPYGLKGGNASPQKEIPFNGVYRVDKKGNVTLLESELTYPNGIAFSPDEKTLYIAVSDPDKPVVMAYNVKADGTLDINTRRIFFDAAPLAKAGAQGSPDGLKVDKSGNVWTTGPGGVLVISPEGKHLGTIKTGELIANCAWGNNGTVLYLTSHSYLCRIQTLVRGVGPGFTDSHP